MSYSLQFSEENIKELLKVILKLGGVYMIYDSNVDEFRNYEFLNLNNSIIKKREKNLYTFEKDMAPKIIRNFINYFCDPDGHEYPLSYFHIVPVVLFPEGVYKADFSGAISFMEMFE